VRTHYKTSIRVLVVVGNKDDPSWTIRGLYEQKERNKEGTFCSSFPPGQRFTYTTYRHTKLGGTDIDIQGFVWWGVAGYKGKQNPGGRY